MKEQDEDEGARRRCMSKAKMKEQGEDEDLTRLPSKEQLPQMAVDKEAIFAYRDRVYSYYLKCNLTLFYV